MYVSESIQDLTKKEAKKEEDKKEPPETKPEVTKRTGLVGTNISAEI